MSDDEESPPQAQPEGSFLFTRLTKKPRIPVEEKLEEIESKMHQDSLPILKALAGHIPRDEVCEMTMARLYLVEFQHWYNRIDESHFLIRPSYLSCEQVEQEDLRERLVDLDKLYRPFRHFNMYGRVRMIKGWKETPSSVSKLANYHDQKIFWKFTIYCDETGAPPITKNGQEMAQIDPYLTAWYANYMNWPYRYPTCWRYAASHKVVPIPIDKTDNSKLHESQIIEYWEHHPEVMIKKSELTDWSIVDA